MGPAVIHPGVALPEDRAPLPVQVYQRGATTQGQALRRRPWRELSPISTGFPQRAISSGSGASTGCPSAAVRNHRIPEEQVPRYASPLGSCSKASRTRTLWTTCALRGIACAQSVGKVVDSKKTFSCNTRLTCGNDPTSMWSKYFFRGISSTAHIAASGRVPLVPGRDAVHSLPPCPSSYAGGGVQRSAG